MRRHLQQSRRKLVAATLLALFSTAVYLLTMSRSVSWWDCGEFISTGWLLMVGHPPGAPTYQLLSHLFMLFSFGNPLLIAPLSNALSAVAAGLTVAILYLTVLELQGGDSSAVGHLAAASGAVCYMLCDAVWFSAVESEVYALAMFFASLVFLLALRYKRKGDGRRLMLISLLIGLGLGVHMLTLLVLPAVAVVLIPSKKDKGAVRRSLRLLLPKLPLVVFFFFLGLTPFLITPIRSAAHPPINQANPSSAERYLSYLRREQYAKAPLYPRIWREGDEERALEWTFGKKGLLGNILYYVDYQLGSMYGRYFMYSFLGRENLKSNRVVIFVLPFMLGIIGLLRQRKRSRRDFWAVLAMFLFGGVILNFYLNHPCYEPRERDYVYVLSFYAFSIWIGLGGADAAQWIKKKAALPMPLLKALLCLLLLSGPVLMFAGNLSDHDRHGIHSVHDISLNHLQSCDPRAILISYGDNDTFPLWYLQYVERRRTDVEVHNVNIEGYATIYELIRNNAGERPVYLTQYAYEHVGKFFGKNFQCEGFCWRILPPNVEPSGAAFERHLRDSISWHITSEEYIDWVSERLLMRWEETYPFRTGNR